MISLPEQLKRAAMKASDESLKGGWTFEVVVGQGGIGFRAWAYEAGKIEHRRYLNVPWREVERADQMEIGINGMFEEFAKTVRPRAGT